MQMTDLVKSDSLQLGNNMQNHNRKSKSKLKSFAPLLVILAGLAFALSQGWHQQLTPDALAHNAVYLDGLVKDNFWLVLIAFIIIYAAATAFMVPASALTIGGGFLFGVAIGAPATVIGATIGACILFLVAKSSLGETLKSISGPFLSKMEEGFNENAISYLFTIRLIPVFPFAVANIAPAILGAKFRDYAFTTLLGIIPGTIAYSWIGSGLRGTLLDAAKTGEVIDTGAIVSAAGKNMLPAFIALAVVAMIPVVYKKFRAAKV